MNADRRGRALAAMADAGIDALILGREANARYVSGARRLWLAGARAFAPGCVLVASGDVHLLSTSDDGVPADVPVENLYAITWNPANLMARLARVLARQARVPEAQRWLDRALKLAPSHADSHIAYGAYQAEVVNKVGGLVAGMTYGAKKDSALEHFQKALKLNPDSAIARIEYANGLILLFGKDKIEEATKLYEQAAKCKPMDAMERLDVEMARSELE